MLRALIFLLAISAGGAAAWLAYSMQGPATVAAAQPAPVFAVQDVLVAAVDLAPGEALGEGNLRWQSWPEDIVSDGFILRSGRPQAPGDLSGLVVRSGFAAGEPIRDSRLMSADKGFLSLMLPPGKRAVAVKVSAENTAGGFILPNSHVDVLHTTSDEGVASRTILRNVRVLAIDQMISDQMINDTGSDAVVGKTATLELDSRQVEVVTAAEASGMLSLSLRSTADNAEVPGVEQPQSRRVQIFRAGLVEVVVFR